MKDLQPIGAGRCLSQFSSCIDRIKIEMWRYDEIAVVDVDPDADRGGLCRSPRIRANLCTNGNHPYTSIDGRWTKTDSVVRAGTQEARGPQPISGGAWSWSGCGTGGTGREQTFAVNAIYTANATLINTCGAKTHWSLAGAGRRAARPRSPSP